MAESFIRSTFTVLQKMEKRLFIPVVLLLATLAAGAQEVDSMRFGVGFVKGNDTIIHHDLKEVWIYPQRQYKSPRYQRQYGRLVQRVKKVYPYAKRANELLRQYEPEYLSLKTDRERRKLIKKVESQLMAQYKEEFKKMTISEGKILIKLIDRETGRTSFTLIKEFRGDFTAFFWQSIARLFGNNLKDEFDPYGEDRMIEEIVVLVEIGYL